MLDQDSILKLLKPFDLNLRSDQLGQLRTYLELLVRWNRKINLTSVRTPEECVTRHFAESLYITRFVPFSGSLLDIGSGAGFPGLALRIVLSDLSTTLLEPVAKKRAFLKEVARICNIPSVEVRPERLEEFLEANPEATFETVTARAVGNIDQLARLAQRCLKPGGQLCLWLGQTQAAEIRRGPAAYLWSKPLHIPMTRERCIMVGTVAPSPGTSAR
jgi:16S rRNA (guanine527-N7)-methyltransferase